MISWITRTYKFRPLFESQEEKLGSFCCIGVGGYTSSFISPGHGVVNVAIPVNRTLDLSLEVAWVFAWQQCHLFVEV